MIKKYMLCTIINNMRHENWRYEYYSYKMAYDCCNIKMQWVTC